MSHTPFKILREQRDDPEEIFEHIKNGLQPYKLERRHKALPCFPDYHAIQIVMDFFTEKRTLPKGWPVEESIELSDFEEEIEDRQMRLSRLKHLLPRLKLSDLFIDRLGKIETELRLSIDKLVEDDAKKANLGPDAFGRHIDRLYEFAESQCNDFGSFQDDETMIKSWACLCIPEDGAEFHSLVAKCDKEITFKDIDLEACGLIEHQQIIETQTRDDNANHQQVKDDTQEFLGNSTNPGEKELRGYKEIAKRACRSESAVKKWGLKRLRYARYDFSGRRGDKKYPFKKQVCIYPSALDRFMREHNKK